MAMKVGALKEVKPLMPVEMIDGIQEAAPTHVPGMVALGKQALQENPAPRQRISYEKLTNLARECIASPNNYAKVSVKDGEVVASVCAIVDEQMLYERKQATVVQFYTKAAGEGMKLIRDFLKWARAQRKIKSIVFMVEFGADPRIKNLLERLGLACDSPVLVEWR